MRSLLPRIPMALATVSLASMKPPTTAASYDNATTTEATIILPNAASDISPLPQRQSSMGMTYSTISAPDLSLKLRGGDLISSSTVYLSLREADHISSSSTNVDLFLLDFRRAADFQNSHISGAINVCLPTLLYKRLQKGRLNLASLVSECSLRERFLQNYATSLLILIGYSHQTDFEPGQSSSSNSVTSDQHVTANNGYDNDCMFLVAKQLADQHCKVAILAGGFEEFRSTYPKLCSSSASSLAATATDDDSSFRSGSDPSSLQLCSNSAPSNPAPTESSQSHQACSLLRLHQLRLSSSQPNSQLSSDSSCPASSASTPEGTTGSNKGCHNLGCTLSCSTHHPHPLLTSVAGRASEDSAYSSSDLSSYTSSPNNEITVSAAVNGGAMVRSATGGGGKLTVNCCAPSVCPSVCDEDVDLVLHSSCNGEAHLPRPAMQQNRFPVEIIPYLFLGNEQNSSNLETLDCFEIRYILNVTPDLPNAFKDRQSKGFKYLQIPIADHWSQNLSDHFPKAIEFIDEGRRNHVGVLVHCLAGISRSVTVMVAYLMYHLSLSLDEAYDIVKAQKPNVSPNFNFMGQLLEWERKLQDSNRTPTDGKDASRTPMIDRSGRGSVCGLEPPFLPPVLGGTMPAPTTTADGSL